jgi:haloalkane dehalogenase
MSHFSGGISYFVAAFGLLALVPQNSSAQTPSNQSIQFVEHHIKHGANNIYVRDFPGREPAFVMLHGFPDNLHIYDELAPLLSASGRRVITFDFLGFGDSDKPEGFKYSFVQQVDDLAAVVDGLKLAKFIPVAHDAGGPAAINYVLAHPDRVSSIVLLNTIYGDSPTLRMPELITLCASADLKALAGAIMSDPKQREWLLTFQNQHFLAKASPKQKDRFNKILQPIINANFASKPGAGPAFMAMTSDLHANAAYNDKHLQDLSKITVPVYLVWGSEDPYLNTGVAEDLASHFKNSTLKLVPLGHWPQVDDPKQVADLMISLANVQ